MGETSKKVTAGPVANSKRVKASTGAPAKKATTKKATTKKVAEKKPATSKRNKDITELGNKGVVQAPALEKVVNKKESKLARLWRKWLGL